jgi:hypothetical protein
MLNFNSNHRNVYRGNYGILQEIFPFNEKRIVETTWFYSFEGWQPQSQLGDGFSCIHPIPSSAGGIHHPQSLPWLRRGLRRDERF